MTAGIPRRHSQLALTPRQQAVLDALRNPKLTRTQAAKSIGISYRAIHRHITNILDRLNVLTLEEAFQLIPSPDSSPTSNLKP
jgi:DNA-binding NarL/FixJ family response regulator